MAKKPIQSIALTGFRLVLVGPRTPGNVGSCARVAANFGCWDWFIADSHCVWSGWDARVFATGASREFLEAARPVDTVQEAVRDCQIAIGFSRRQGKKRKATIELSEIAELARGNTRVALVFGNEETGLSSDELEACTRLCTLPTSEIAPSMNLSHAVAVVLGRIYSDLWSRAQGQMYGQASGQYESQSQTQSGQLSAQAGRPVTPARVGDLEAMIQHWGEYLADIGMTTAGNPGRLLTSLRKIFARASLSPREVRVLRGFLSKAQVKLGVRKRGRRVVRTK